MRADSPNSAFGINASNERWIGHGKGDSEMTTTATSMAIFAIVAALGLLGVVVVMVAATVPLQQAEAAQPPGKDCEFARGGNASQGRCIH
ncbi:MAG TPA: hypothetical protein VKB06_01780 [Nitrososphaera sp.]|nr:hypothetical protein [Nitrososphaera sp.]